MEEYRKETKKNTLKLWRINLCGDLVTAGAAAAAAGAAAAGAAAAGDAGAAGTGAGNTSH